MQLKRSREREWRRLRGGWEEGKHDIRFGSGLCMHTYMYARRKIAALSANGTLGTSLELHPFSWDLSLSSDKQYTPRLRYHEVIYGVCRVIGMSGRPWKSKPQVETAYWSARIREDLRSMRYDKSINSGISNFKLTSPPSLSLSLSLSLTHSLTPLSLDVRHFATLSDPSVAVSTSWNLVPVKSWLICEPFILKAE